MNNTNNNGLVFYDNQPPIDNGPKIVSGGVSFSYLKNNDAPMPIVPDPPETAVSKPKRGRPKKSSNESDIVRAEVVTESMGAYSETNNLIKQTIAEVDTLTVELKDEMDTIRSSRTLKNKYNYLTNISMNIGSLLGTKIQAIKEMNSVIKSATDLDYKRQKDMNAAAAADSDQQIYSLYNAFVNSPVNSGGAGLSALGPNTAQMSLSGVENIVRVDSGSTLDNGYQNFRANMTPEQRMMVVEDQVDNVIVYDKATGNKYFDVVDRNGNSVQGVPRRDPMFLEDFTIDTRNKIARNINLNETLPVVIINENKKFDEY